jgi:hypothetical protein
MIIDLIFPPEFTIDSAIIDWAKNNKCCFSFFNTDSYFDYNKDHFIETLKDWGNYNEMS